MSSPRRAPESAPSRRPLALARAATIALLLPGCAGLSARVRSGREDVHSFARPDRVRVTHVSLDLALDFAARRVAGSATLTLERLDPRAPLLLDTQALAIEFVQDGAGQPLEWSLGEENGRLGRRLAIELNEGDALVRVRYHTTPQGEALQFLGPEQTSGAHPFLFTQGQAILTRSWIPLQDSPSVRVTYDAAITAPRPLTVLMSAASRSAPEDCAAPGEPPRARWRFRMEQPVPSYLIALACGELSERVISPRCSVWAEPPVADAAAREFADTEAMIERAEALFGPYRWQRYDVLVLPPAFPFGGMENPTLTFLTPTAIAGDRSLVSIIAHELAHSWSGNLVTNATWRDFWLNEGFTVYFERRIMEELYGAERVAMEELLDWNSLAEELGELEPELTVLHVDLAGRHPDDGFSAVPYNKGALLLHRLEQLFGRASLDRALRAWFDENAFQSRTTADWEAFLRRELLPAEGAGRASLDLDEWLRRPGLPDDAPRPASRALERVDVERERFLAGEEPERLATGTWVTQQWLHFLNGLPRDLPPAALERLERAFAFTESGNCEVLASWLELGIRAGYEPSAARLEEFLMTVGRRKFLLPLYEALVAVDPERARDVYRRARPRYHAVSAVSLDALVFPAERR